MTNTIHKKYKFLLFVVFALLINNTAWSQAQSFFHPYKYGKNRIQYKQFNWRYIESPHFEVYFYDGGFTVSKLTAEYVESEFKRITELVGFSPYYKTKLLIYNSIQDLQQSNIGIYYQGYKASGQTRFVRPEVEIAFNGNKSDYYKELTHGISDAFIFEMMYGGSLKDMLKNSYLLNLPDWFMTGASLYIAEGWSKEMDDYVRDFLSKNKKLPKIRYLEGKEAIRIGQSIWNYMAEKYGKANVSSVLNLTRIVRDEKVSIENTLGISYEDFIADWEKFYRSQLENLDNNYTDIDPENILLKNRKRRIYNKIKLTPDGIWAAYTENDQGKYKVKVKNMITGKTKVILKGGYRVVNQQIDFDTPLVGWANNKELVIFSQKKGKNKMWIYDTSKPGLWDMFRYIKKKVEFQFEHINDFNVSPDGRKLVLSAERRGQSDIFIHDIKRRRTWQITKDLFDDSSPSFMSNSQDIIFSSNRTNDSTKIIEADQKDISDNFNIFLYKKDSPEVLQKLTNNIGEDSHPLAIDDENLTFLSSQKGITELYHYNIKDSTYKQLTDFKYSLKEYFVQGDKVAYILFENGRENIYYDDFTLKPAPFTAKTHRQSIMDARMLQEIKRKKEREEQEKKALEERNRLAEEQKKKEEQEKLEGKEKEELVPKLEDEDPEEEEIDTDNYKFDTFSPNKRKNFLTRYKAKLQAKEEAVGRQRLFSRPVEYKNRFSVEEFVSTLKVDPLRGTGLLFEPRMTDILENHKINAGLFGDLNLTESSFYMEYEYLPKRFDYRLRFERNTLDLSANVGHKYSLNMLEASISYPMSIRSRVTIAPFFANTRVVSFYNTAGGHPVPDLTKMYVGLNAEYVFDNSFVIGKNMIQGTRAKARLEHYTGITDNTLGFGNFSIDVRHYQPIIRALTLATRVSYGSFFGESPKSYMLGGVDNWLFNSFDGDPRGVSEDFVANDPDGLTDLMFMKFATPMRGFKYNALPGGSWESMKDDEGRYKAENVILFNAEFRLSVIKLFTKKIVKSNFIRNLQLTTFLDAGTAWTGLSPFHEDNTLNQKTIEPQGNFSGNYKTFEEPFILGHGFGVRTMLLGYYLKLDVSWPIENGFRSSDEIWQLSLGHDF